jgi:hypothetical protein
MSGFLNYIHEFHPYDALLVVPVVVSVWLFLKQRDSGLGFAATLFGSAVASTFVSLVLMALITGPWALIGITAGLIFMIYVPICLAVGLITITAAKLAARKSNA